MRPESIVDRPAIMGQICDCLLDDSAPKPGVLVASAIQGQGGIGKTVLAQLLAHETSIRTRFQDGVYWLPFGQEPKVLSSLGDLIQIFDPTFKASTEQGASAFLQGLLSDKSALLVLCEIWRDGADRPVSVLHSFGIGKLVSHPLVLKQSEQKVFLDWLGNWFGKVC